MKARSPALGDRQFAFVACSVVAAIAAHVEHVPATLMGLAAAIVVVACAMRARGHGVVPAWIRVPLVVLLPALVILRFGNVFGREPGSALVCGMLALKLLETRTRRDGRAAVCFASFVVMSALLFDTSLAFTALLLGVVVLLIATLRELEPLAAVHAPRLAQVFRQSAWALLGAAPLALCAFVFFPRLQTPLWQAPGDDIARTGIGDSMTPGSIQSLLVDDSPAFRVTFDETLPPKRKLYWRGPVLVDFDGATWSRRPTPALGDTALQTSAGRTGYEVTLEPSDKSWLFALDAPLDAPPDSHRLSDLSIVRRRPVNELLRYRVESALDYRLDLALSPSERRRTLALPSGFDPRSVELAATWRTELGSDDAIIAKALAMFHADFTYTLSPPAVGRDSVDDFVFGTRRGFCEYFASAFVFLMRGAGIPARVVTGYQGGFFNDVGNYLLVRQSDAHAWAEVWLAGKGWVRVDPTAAVSPQRIEVGAAEAAGSSAPWYQVDWIRGVRNQLDLINRGWNSAIVQFNALRQQNLLTPFGFEKADYMTLTWALIGTSSCLLLLATFWVMRTPRRRVDPLDAAYALLCAKLARVGVARAPAEGPADYAARTRDADARSLLQRYAALRYATTSPDAPSVAAFMRQVRSWRPAAA